MSVHCPTGRGGQTMANEIPVNPPDMRKVYLRLKRWRSSHGRRVPIPESLWAAAGPDEDRAQGCGHGGVGGAEPGAVGRRGMIQITPQMRILVAVEAVDGRKGIDSLARLCQERLAADPFSGW